jgi:hypothetical protein
VLPIVRCCRFVAALGPNTDILASISGSGALLLVFPAYARSFAVPSFVIERRTCPRSTGEFAVFYVRVISSMSIDLDISLNYCFLHVLLLSKQKTDNWNILINFIYLFQCILLFHLLVQNLLSSKLKVLYRVT